MINEEFEAMRIDRTEDLTHALINNNMRIANIIRSAYERGYADGIKQQRKRQQIKVLIGGEQVYPRDEKCEDAPKPDSHSEYWDNIGRADKGADE